MVPGRSTTFVLAAAILATLAAAPAAGAKAKGFSYGVAAGDVTSSSAILWLRSPRAR
jgi:phosphodiesterase/alkaline phosphatase D-like protein